MITPDKRIEQKNFANLTDYSVKCPKGLRDFFAFVGFEDDSECLLSNIFAVDRKEAMKIVLDRFADCIGYISRISLQEC